MVREDAIRGLKTTTTTTPKPKRKGVGIPYIICQSSLLSLLCVFGGGGGGHIEILFELSLSQSLSAIKNGRRLSLVVTREH